MAYPATVFRILIASPSDVVEERDIAEHAIQHWNDLNSPERQVVLLPVRWESHAAPNYGERPQETINRQVASDCDLVIAIFWTRIGSPTGSFDSGTIEEIERAASAGKPVMLYFSRSKHDPETIDLDQLKRLREFKAKTLPNALVEHYSTQTEFRDKFAKQLEIQIRGLMTETPSGPSDGANQIATDIQLHFSDPESGAPVGDHLTLDSTSLVFHDFAELPDYAPPTFDTPKSKTKKPFDIGLSQPNRHFYRQYATYVAQRLLLRPLHLWLKNSGVIGARDVYVEVILTSNGVPFLAIPSDEVPRSAPTHNGWDIFDKNKHASSPEAVISRATERWGTTIEIPAMQPQRIITPPTLVMIGALNSCIINMEAIFYADVLSVPVKKQLTVSVNTRTTSASAKDVVNEFLNDEGLRIDAPSTSN